MLAPATIWGRWAAAQMILIDANNVTVQNLTVDGDNPTLPSGNPAIGGADIDAQTGIVTNFNAVDGSSNPITYTGMTVKNVTVKNIFLRGIEYADGNNNANGAFDFENNTVINVQGDDIFSIAIFNSGGNGTIANNTVSATPSAITTDQSYGTDIFGNTITNSALAIQSDNNGNLVGTSVADSIHNNNISLGISLGGVPSYGILVFVPRKAVTVQNNTLPRSTWASRHVAAPPRFGCIQRQHGGRECRRNWRKVSTDTGSSQLSVTASFSGDSYTGTGSATGLQIERIGASPPIASVTLTNTSFDTFTKGIDDEGGTVTFNAGNSITNATTGLLVSVAAHVGNFRQHDQ